MAANSSIEWTEATWNPVTGCSKISPGCKHCYAERLANRLKKLGVARYRNGFKVTLQPDQLPLPIRWRKPKMIFVNSMSDLFHSAVPLQYIREVFSIMEACPHHTFQLLTKRSDRLLETAHLLPWRRNIWVGVSVENGNFLHRVEHLKRVPAHVRFLSLEPLLGPIYSLPLAGISWVIVGGESGPRARPMLEAWVQNILHQCRAARVPFFFKQWGGVMKSRNGRTLNGRTYDEMPLTGAGQSVSSPAVYAATI